MNRAGGLKIYAVRCHPIYNWRKKYSGMDASQLKELKELKKENRRLKQMYADLSLDNAMLKDVLSKKF
jgi:putative transposase